MPSLFNITVEEIGQFISFVTDNKSQLDFFGAHTSFREDREMVLRMLSDYIHQTKKRLSQTLTRDLYMDPQN